MTQAEIDDAISHMEMLGRDESGWCTLYRTKETMILHELVYPRSEMHGGGPRELRPISREDAIAKYGQIELNA